MQTSNSLQTRHDGARLLMVKKLILFLSIACASGLTMVTVYNTIIDSASWGSDIPSSIQTARDYFQHVDPRRFYAVAGPVNQILILLTIILFWKDEVVLRFCFAGSFLFYTAIIVMTLAYFIPRDLILFTSSIPDHLEQIKTASAEWSRMNWLRFSFGLAGVLLSFKGLDTYYRDERKGANGVFRSKEREAKRDAEQHTWSGATAGAPPS